MAEIKKHIPNALGILRLFLGLAFFFFPHSYRLLVVIVAALTDVLDGFLARRWNAQSALGQIIDPLADKVFVAAMMVTFLIEARITLAMFLLIAARDIVVALGAFAIWATGRAQEIIEVESRPLGKATTVFQIVFLISVLFLGFGVWPIVAVTGVVSILAGLDYATYYLRNVRPADLPQEA